MLIHDCRTGYANHGDYLFGWQGDALQRAMDSPCYQNCPTLKSQVAADMNKCTIGRKVVEDIDGCKLTIPSQTNLVANEQ